MWKNRKRRWKILSPDNKRLAEKLSRDLNISKVLGTILVNRNISNSKEGERFLFPELSHLYDPHLLKDVQKASLRIKKALENKEKILVFGDWDVDGICSCALLIRILSQLKADLNYFIPEREEYGLKVELIKKFKKEDIGLIITVDCGVSNIEEIKYAKSLGIDTIVIDHHEVKDTLPSAYAIVNPKQRECSYPFKELAGVGVVFKVVQVLLYTLSRDENAKERLDNYLFENYLDLVTIGTIADVVPLIEENRILVKFGLLKLKSTKKVGLKALLSQLNLEKFSSKELSFKLIPVLNSAGRMDKSLLGADLLCSKDSNKAISLAEQLLKLNQSRKILLQECSSLIYELFSNQVNLSEDKVIIITAEKIHSGLIGILANRLLESYFRPTIVFALEKDRAKGSARCFENFDLIKALEYCKDLLIDYGGHKKAAGLNIKKENISKFKKLINEYAQDKLSEEELFPELLIDCEVNINELNLKLLEELSLLEPYGEGNNQPIFILKDIQILEYRLVGINENHLKLKVGNFSQDIEAIGFNMRDHFPDNLRKCDLVFHLNLNNFNGIKRPQLQILSIK